MPRRHPLPPPARPALLDALEERLLAGASQPALEDVLARDAALAEGVAALGALGLRATSARELCDLTLAAALRAELAAFALPAQHAAARRAAEALVAARLVARIAQRCARAPGLACGELVCLPLVRALARTRLEAGPGASGSAAREAVAIARAWGLSGGAIELLEDAASGPERHLIELAERLAAGPETGRGGLGRAALERLATLLGLRTAELAELGDLAASARATGAA